MIRRYLYNLSTTYTYIFLCSWQYCLLDLTLTQDLLESALPLSPNNRFLWHVTICLARRRIALAARLPVVFRYINMIGTPTKRYATVNSRDIGERFQSIPLPEMQMDMNLYSLLKLQHLSPIFNIKNI